MQIENFQRSNFPLLKQSDIPLAGLATRVSLVLLVYSLALDIGPEPMLLVLQLCLERLVGTPDGLDLEQALHLLQWHTARLWNEEEGVKEGEEGERREEEVDAVAPSLEHLLGEARDEEVEQPVAAGGERLC